MSDQKEIANSDGVLAPSQKNVSTEKQVAGPLSSSSVDLESTETVDRNYERSLVRKLDRNLLPVLTLLYLLSFLDRSNVGNARLEGLTADLHMTGNQYLTTLTMYFIGYVLFEVPSNIVLKRTSPKLWLPTLTLLWGVVSTLMGLTQNFSGFLAVRFFLGVAESGLFPGVVFYMSMWYKRAEQHYRIALFFSAASLAGAFGGILAWGIAHMRGVGGYHGWRWIFILEGILTVLVSLGAYFFVHNYPTTATFLSPEEKSLVINRLKNDSDAIRDEEFTWAGVRKALKDPKVYLYGLGFHTMSLPLYTLSLFLPTIIAALGYTAAQAQLMTVPPYAVATSATVLVAILSERYQRRGAFIVITSSIAALGYIILLSVPIHKPGASYFGTILAATGIYPSTALVLAWPANNVSGQTKRCTANALQISIGNLGAILGTQLYRPKTSPHFFLGHGFALGYLIANIAVVCTLWIVLKKENDRKARIQDVKDLGSISSGEWDGDEDPRWIFQM